MTDDAEDEGHVALVCDLCGTEFDPDAPDAACPTCGATGHRTLTAFPPAARFEVSEPVRPDGFRPIALGVMLWRGVVGFPQDERYWFMASAARRIDFAHRQLERARNDIDAYDGDPAKALVVLADVESAFGAMHRAIEMALGVNGRFSTPATFPAVVEQKRAAVEALRNAYEHIDERALGIIEGRVLDPQEAHSLFAGGGYGADLIEKREVSYRHHRFGLDAEATELLVALRTFVLEAWVAMCGEEIERRKLDASSS